MPNIRACTFEEVESSGLLDLYSAECAIDSLPVPSADPNRYAEMIGSGALTILGYFKEDVLVGFISCLVIPTPHYLGRSMVATESIFVHPDHRAGGAGIRLLREAEVFAAVCGAMGLIVAAPAGGKLSKVLASMDNYRLTNEVYIRGFK